METNTNAPEAKQPASAGCHPTTCSPSLAEKIATALLTPYGGPECHRLQLMLRVDPGITTVSTPERNMGGRNKQSVIDTINRVLMDHEANATDANETQPVNARQDCPTCGKPGGYPECPICTREIEAEGPSDALTCSASLIWHAGPARGGGGTSQSESPNGHTSWWWDGDLLLVVVETNGGPFVRLVKVNADGDLLSFDDPDTGDDNFGYTDMDISWWARIEESLPQNADGDGRRKSAPPTML